MIKIIEKHSPTEFRRKYKFTCNHCHSVVMFTDDEIKIHNDNRNETYVSFECPVCHWSMNARSKAILLNYKEFEQ